MDAKFPIIPMKVRICSEAHVVPAAAYARRRRILSFFAQLRSLRRVRRMLGTPSIFDQTSHFMAHLGITFDDAQAEAERACGAIGASFSQLYTSSHYTMFAALALSGLNPANILEIGTGSGQATRFLAELFPKAKIHTVELPQSDPIYGPNAGRFNTKKRATFLDVPQIHAHEINSAFLPELNLPDLDLIWLDGGHAFPEVAWDHFYCMAKIRKGGWIMSDDVRLPDNPLYCVYEGSADVYQSLRYYAERTAHKFFLVLKRTDLHRNLFDPKYVAAIHVA